MPPLLNGTFSVADLPNWLAIVSCAVLCSCTALLWWVRQSSIESLRCMLVPPIRGSGIHSGVWVVALSSGRLQELRRRALDLGGGEPTPAQVVEMLVQLRGRVIAHSPGPKARD